jgi:hypothetical protein
VPQTFRNNIALTATIVLSALLFWMVASASHSVRGVIGPTIAMSASPTSTALWTILALALSMVLALGLARVVNTVVAMFALGCGVGMLAMQSGSIQDFTAAAAGTGSNSLLPLAVETAIWGVVTLAASIFLFRLGGPLPDAVPIDEPRRDGMFGTKAFLSLATGPLVLLGVWAIAVNPSKGQILGGVVIGGLLVGLTGRLFAPITPPALLYAAPMLFGAVGHLVAHIMLKGAPLRTAFVDDSLLRIAYPMPIDYVAGTLAGVSLGIGMARSFMKQETPDGVPQRS